MASDTAATVEARLSRVGRTEGLRVALGGDLRFDDGVQHRDTGSKSRWHALSRPLQAAIILAANRQRADLWELLRAETQADYLRRGAELTGETPPPLADVRAGLARLPDASTSHGEAPTGANSPAVGGEQPCEAPHEASRPPVLPIVLNSDWRVSEDAVQWMLERRERAKDRDRWRPERFFRTRRVLLRDIGELCGHVEPAALAQVRALPERHS